MITPAGSECPYYYEDFHRGRERQECRLIDRTPGGGEWHPSLCGKCPVPRIVQANACPHLVLEARAQSSMLGLRRSVEVTAMCSESLEEVAEPQIGCGRCHIELDEFLESSDAP